MNFGSKSGAWDDLYFHFLIEDPLRTFFVTCDFFGTFSAGGQKDRQLQRLLTTDRLKRREEEEEETRATASK